ncbi:carbohydrate sulfotransferase 11-like [Saccoglossus kowalevskii]|uniref:Carbohydrate sulfotransferase n=1 Tax=Saccoglossus kowalevskii TaxID=10224 RepID=A0ABM0GUH7_SACKO|nr:PREDICTED: carbohydrate sulfotransferase 11-like [Saccoglossus kowalevskii]
MEEEQKKRSALVHQICDKYKVESTLQTISSRTLDHLIVDDEHKLIYCFIPKVACTNWKKIMLFLSPKNRNYSTPDDIEPETAHHDNVMIRHLNSYSKTGIERRLKEYIKFIFVREPMERLLSAYLNKFTKHYESSKAFQLRYGTQIIAKYRKNPSPESIKFGHDVTFHEFIRYILDHDTFESRPMNEHWLQFYHMCHPCLIDYNFIGKYQTLMEDAGNLLKLAKIDHLVSFPETRLSQGRTQSITKDYYKQITSSEIHSLWQMYVVDYLMFGYTYPKFKASDQDKSHD